LLNDAGVPVLPQPRGPISARILEALGGPPEEDLAGVRVEPTGDALVDEDLQLSLFLCYQLHYRGWSGVDEDWEWQPSLLTVRAALEAPFERALRQRFSSPTAPVSPDELPDRLADLVANSDGPSLSRFVQRHATREQFDEFVKHRSVYQLREADAHTWAIPRLSGAAKAALVEIQIDEYGGGRPERMHAELFANTMRRLGLDTRYGTYLDCVPAITLASNNLMSLFGLHRRLRGALLGHLAIFEMTSSLSNRRYGNGLRRLGGDANATHFYDEHVVADAVHEQIAAHDLCGGYARAEPDRAGDVLFGAQACLGVEGRFASELIDAWSAGRSSLRSEAACGGRPAVAGGAR
jgi:hypothetical protein